MAFQLQSLEKTRQTPGLGSQQATAGSHAAFWEDSQYLLLVAPCIC